ncbi:MAG TPA: hypothetical protein VEU62_20735 [Bryobacterales bacterium]|nr:hypothetical protein [Bryobacterales bacterium]
MRTHSLIFAALLLAGTGARAADTNPDAGVDAQAAFARLKSLAGEWQADTSMGKARLTYQVIAGGTAVVERETAEQMPEMLTVFHLDGSRLLLTHYCLAGNQPRMEARSFDVKSAELAFRFLDATNLASKDTGHMHNARIRFVDADHVTTSWDFYESGRLKNTETFQYFRVK